MHFFMFFFVAVLFFLLTPGIVLSLPIKGSKTTVALTHAVIFAFIFCIIHKSVWDWGVKNGWISGGHRYNRSMMIENMTMPQCKEKNGTYKAGYCYDSSGKEIE